MKKEILTKVGELAAYLSNNFANSFHVDQNGIIGAFRLNFSEDELSRVVTAMFTKKKTTLATNLSTLGYQDINDPTQLSFYFSSFDGKTRFKKFIEDYNEAMESIGEENKVIEYTDTTGVLMSSVKVIVDAVSYVLIAFVSISFAQDKPKAQAIGQIEPEKKEMPNENFSPFAPKDNSVFNPEFDDEYLQHGSDSGETFQKVYGDDEKRSVSIMNTETGEKQVIIDMSKERD